MKHERHHYIPQCYLKGFSTNRKSVWIYNKSKSKTYPTAIENIFYEKNFYTIDKNLIPEEGQDIINPDSIEYDFFAEHIESQYADILKIINKAIDGWSKNIPFIVGRRIPECWVNHLSLQLLIQYLRTPEARKEAFNLLKITRIIMAEYSKNSFISDEEKIRYEEVLQKTYGESIDHFMVLFDKERLIDPCWSLLRNKIWSVYFSPNVDFFTSDSPIIFEREGSDKDINFMEFNLSYLNITYPITRHLLIRLWDRESYKELEPCDRMIRVVDKEFVMKENIRQYVWARREVVTPDDESAFFERIRDIRHEEFYCKH